MKTRVWVPAPTLKARQTWRLLCTQEVEMEASLCKPASDTESMRSTLSERPRCKTWRSKMAPDVNSRPLHVHTCKLTPSHTHVNKWAYTHTPHIHTYAKVSKQMEWEPVLWADFHLRQVEIPKSCVTRTCCGQQGWGWGCQYCSASTAQVGVVQDKSRP